MAYYDSSKGHRCKKGKELLKALKGEEADLIREYVDSVVDWSDKQRETIKEMQKVFDGIAKFTGARKGPTVYG